MFSLATLYFVFLTVAPLTALLFPLHCTARARDKVAVLIQQPQIQQGNPPSSAPCSWAGCGKGVSSPKDPQTNKMLPRLPETHQHSELPPPHHAGPFKECKSNRLCMEESNKREQNRWRKKRTATNEGFCLKFASCNPGCNIMLVQIFQWSEC